MSKNKFFTPTYFAVAAAVGAFFLFKKGDAAVDALLPPAFMTKISMLGGTSPQRLLAAESFFAGIDNIHMDITYSPENHVSTILSDQVLSTQDVQFSKGDVEVTIKASTRIAS